MTFIADSQLLLYRLRWVRFLWLSVQILNYCYFAWGGLDFYGFHCKFSIIVILPDVEFYDFHRWFSIINFMAFTTDSQLLSLHLRRIRFL